MEITQIEIGSGYGTPETSKITGFFINIFNGFLGLTGRVVEPISNSTDINLLEVKDAVSNLSGEELDVIAEGSKIEVLNEEFKVVVNESKAEEVGVEYKWGYKVKLKDLKFMAKIDVTSDEEIILVDNSSLKVGDKILSFKDLVDSGYKVRIGEPVLEIGNLSRVTGNVSVVEQNFSEEIEVVENITEDKDVESNVTEEVESNDTKIIKNEDKLKKEKEETKKGEKEKDEKGEGECYDDETEILTLEGVGCDGDYDVVEYYDSNGGLIRVDKYENGELIGVDSTTPLSNANTDNLLQDERSISDREDIAHSSITDININNRGRRLVRVVEYENGELISTTKSNANTDNLLQDEGSSFSKESISISEVSNSPRITDTNINNRGVEDKNKKCFKGKWKFFKDLNKTERVMTLNNKTGESEWQKPTAYQVFNNSELTGEMFSIKTVDEEGNEGELVVSEKHKVYVNEEGIESISNLSGYNFIRLPSNSSGFVSLSNLENADINNSGLLCGILLNQTTENILSLGNFEGSSKWWSFVINTLCSDLENSANIPFESLFGLNDASNPCCLRNFNNSFFTFSSNKNFILCRHQFKFPFCEASGELQGCFDMFFGEGNKISIQDFFDRRSCFKQFKDLPDHDSGSFESRGSTTDFIICNNILINLNSHCNNIIDNKIFKDFGGDIVNLILDEESGSGSGSSGGGVGGVDLSNFKLKVITEVYSDFNNGEDVWFLDSENKPVKVESIEIVPYEGQIYDVDVENDIVLVRRKNRNSHHDKSNIDDGDRKSTTPKSNLEQNGLLNLIKSNEPPAHQSPTTQQGLYDEGNIDNLLQDEGSISNSESSSTSKISNSPLIIDTNINNKEDNEGYSVVWSGNSNEWNGTYTHPGDLGYYNITFKANLTTGTMLFETVKSNFNVENTSISITPENTIVNTTDVINVQGRIRRANGTGFNDIFNNTFLMKLNNVFVTSNVYNDSDFTNGEGWQINISNVVQLNLSGEGMVINITDLYNDNPTDGNNDPYVFNYSSAVGYQSGKIFESDAGFNNKQNVTYRFNSPTKFYNANAYIGTEAGSDGGSNSSLL